MCSGHLTFINPFNKCSDLKKKSNNKSNPWIKLVHLVVKDIFIVSDKILDTISCLFTNQAHRTGNVSASMIFQASGLTVTHYMLSLITGLTYSLLPQWFTEGPYNNHFDRPFKQIGPWWFHFQALSLPMSWLFKTRRGSVI